MKNFNLRSALLLCISIITFSSRTALAQDYLITAKGDSVNGVIKMMMYGPEKKVQVITKDRTKTIYSIFQVRSFSLAGETYHPVKGNTGYTFMKLLKSGYLSLYGFQLENQVSYDGRFLRKLDGRGIEIPNLGFKKTVSNFLEDCPDVYKRIDDGKLTKKDTEIIVDEYNACIAARSVLPPAAEATKTVQEPTADKAQLDPWQTLETKVNGMADFEGKGNALEMISEIKSKLAKNEKVPNFMVQGVKEILKQPELQEELNAALKVLP